MSFALPCKRRDAIPAVCHVDGSARLQTASGEAEAANARAPEQRLFTAHPREQVGGEADPRWRALIAAFFALTGVPLVCALRTTARARAAVPPRRT